MVSGRKPMKLHELGIVARGRSRHRPRNEKSLFGGPYPFIQTGDVKNADLYLSHYTQTYNEKGLAQSKLWHSGTLCITIAANIAETSILKIDACFPDSIVGFIPYQGISDVKFVKYYLDTIKLQMQMTSKGTTQDNLSLDKLLTFDILTPSLSTQHKIAAILSAYDDLIENNTRRIAILEEMAQAIYQEWFVRFRYPGHEKNVMVESELGMIPEGWHIAKLEEIAGVNLTNIKKGQEPETINYVDINSVSTGYINNMVAIPFAEAPGRARRMVKNGDIIWSTVRPNRRSYSLIINPVDNLVVSTGFAVISAEDVPYTYLYESLITNNFVDYLVNHTSGAAYPAVLSDAFLAAQILLPPEDLLNLFHNTVAAILSQKYKLHQKNHVLRKTRDLLLPKIISGDIDVEAIDITIPEIIESKEQQDTPIMAQSEPIDATQLALL